MFCWRGEAAPRPSGSVVRAGDGFIAVRTRKDKATGNEKVSMYFDPVALENARRLAHFDLGGGARVDSGTAIMSCRIDFSGPMAYVNAIVANVAVARLLRTLV